jgi:hypothetical protein
MKESWHMQWAVQFYTHRRNSLMILLCFVPNTANKRTTASDKPQRILSYTINVSVGGGKFEVKDNVPSDQLRFDKETISTSLAQMEDGSE